jgi:type IV secretion system protein VirD4
MPLPETFARTLAADAGSLVATVAPHERSLPVAMLRLPERLTEPGLLVGWSLELEHRKTPLGFAFGDPMKTPETGYIDPILMENDGHLITIAPTGAGKGVGCIIPALLRHDGPLIVIDPKGENVAITARYRREMGQQVVVLDPIGVTEQPGAALNPLQLLDPAAATTVDEAAALAATLIDDRGDQRNGFWYDRATHLLTGAILHAVADYPSDERNLPTVRSLIGIAAVDPDRLVGDMMRSVHPEVRAVAQSMASGAPETRGSIAAVAQDGVDFLRGPLVQNATRTTTFDLRDVTLGKPLSIYIVLPPHMLESHGRLLRLWVATLIMAITRRRGRAKTSTLFLLDEAAQLGTLPQLRQAVTLLRGYGLRTWSFWQDLSQLRLLYPADWQTMVNNCQVLQCFGSFNAMAAADIAQLTGFGTPGAVLDLEEREMILQISGDQPVIARLPNYRFDPPFAGTFDPNPYFDPEQDLLPKAPPRIRLYERPPDPPRTARPSVALPTTGEAPRDHADAKAMTVDPFVGRLLEGWSSGARSQETSGT